MRSKKYSHVGIRVDNVSRKFGAVAALDDISLEFTPGLLHGIIGPDGAGKTTLLRTLAGLLRVQRGSISFFADGSPAAFESVRPFIAYMPSRASLYPDLSIEEHLGFFKSLYQLDELTFKKKTESLLAVTRLGEFKARKIGQLSGGMYKKVGLMCALLQSPSVLLLDEPTNGVDPISRREFWELLYGLLEENILILLSTAYMDEAERSGRVHLLDEGRLIASGEPAAIMKSQGVARLEELFGKKALP